MKVYIIFEYHYDDVRIHGVYVSENSANKELESLKDALSGQSKRLGYGYYMDEAEVVDG